MPYRARLAQFYGSLARIPKAKLPISICSPVSWYEKQPEFPQYYKPPEPKPAPAFRWVPASPPPGMRPAWGEPDSPQEQPRGRRGWIAGKGGQAAPTPPPAPPSPIQPRVTPAPRAPHEGHRRIHEQIGLLDAYLRRNGQPASLPEEIQYILDTMDPDRALPTLEGYEVHATHQLFVDLLEERRQRDPPPATPGRAPEAAPAYPPPPAAVPPPAEPEELMHITVEAPGTTFFQDIYGRIELECGPAAEILHILRHIARRTGIHEARLRLHHGGTFLQTWATLRELHLQSPVTLQLTWERSGNGDRPQDPEQPAPRQPAAPAGGTYTNF